MTTIVCALAFEQRALARAGFARAECCGPGRAGITRWAADTRPDPPVVLCGLSGALREGWPVGTAWLASSVMIGDGRCLEPTRRDDDGPVLCSATATVTTPKARHEMAERSGADLVDLESAAFAELCVERGWDWAIVRGVSDAADQLLPETIDSWVNDLGRTRLTRVAAALFTGRVTVADLRRLGSDGAAAMRAVVERIEAMLHAGAPE